MYHLSDTLVPIMAVLNLRNVDAGLAEELKVRAVREGKSLREFCLEILLRGIRNDQGAPRHEVAAGGSGGVTTKDASRTKREKEQAVIPVAPKVELGPIEKAAGGGANSEPVEETIEERLRRKLGPVQRYERPIEEVRHAPGCQCEICKAKRARKS
jgi:plasmid stability protein